MKKDIRKLILASIFIALSIVLTRTLSIQLGNFMRIGFGNIPIILSGIILGPFWGAAVGALSDLVGFAVSPMGGAFIPGLTLSAALWGFIPGLMKHHIFKNKEILSIVISCVICGVFVDGLLNTLWLSLAGYFNFISMLPIRLLKATIMIVVNFSLVTMLIRALKKGKIIEKELV